MIATCFTQQNYKLPNKARQSDRLQPASPSAAFSVRAFIARFDIGNI